MDNLEAMEIQENMEELYEVENVEQECTVEELLIACVMDRPPLWDSRLPIKVRSKTTRDKMWQEIYTVFGENPQYSIEFLSKKWRNLRDTDVRIRNDYTPSGSGAVKKKKWEYFDSLHFLKDTVSYKNTVFNIKPSCGGSSSLLNIKPSCSASDS
uniref:Uncharacterized protein LOC114342324 n=1 Tax=Diabrotica virgifera virgifera TaxID=50390 RepID=A0A6P7GGN3_DIAVI